MRLLRYAVLFCGVSGWWLDPRFNLDHKPQLPEAMAFASPKCSKGLVIDVGANGGRETNSARALGYRVLSVECLVPEYLKLQAQWLNDPMITLLSGCASDSVGMHAFHHASAASSLHSSALGGEAEMKLAKKSRNRVSNVPSFPLDPFLAEGPLANEPLCVLKIDVQGHEIWVMQGIAKAIKKHRPVVIFEYDPRFGPQVNATVPYMKYVMGYDCAVPNPGKGPNTHCSVCNVLCMPDPAMWSAIKPSDFLKEKESVLASVLPKSVPKSAAKGEKMLVEKSGRKWREKKVQKAG